VQSLHALHQIAGRIVHLAGAPSESPQRKNQTA
jgi:hypothetical protein